MDWFNIFLGYVILSIPALLVVYLFKKKSNKQLKEFEEAFNSESDKTLK